MTSCWRCRKCFSPRTHRRGVVEEIRDEDAQAAAPQPLGHQVQRRAHPGALRRLHALEFAQHLVELAAHRTRRQVSAHRVVEQHQPGGVLLLDQQEAERGRQQAAPAQLRDAGAREAHRRALVQEEHPLEVGLLLEHLHVVAVGLAVHLPVHVARCVTRHVLPVLGELDAEAVIGAAMHSLQEPFDHQARAQLHVAQPRHRLRVEEACHARVARRRRPGRGRHAATPRSLAASAR